MKVDFNKLEKAAGILIDRADFLSAAEIYYFMADGDPSLDAGYLGYKIGVCYENAGNILAAKYWYSRAVQENPEIERYRDAENRVNTATVSDVVNRVFSEGS